MTALHASILVLFLSNATQDSSAVDSMQTLKRVQMRAPITTSAKIDSVPTLQNNTLTNDLEAIKENLALIEDKVEGQTWWANVIALFIAIVGGIVALWQVKANVISDARIKWNQELRENLSQFLALADQISAFFRDHTSVAQTQREMFVNLGRLVKLQHQITLSLNKHETKHIELDDLINKVVRALVSLSNDPDDPVDIEGYMTSTIDISRDILKTSWDDAKALKFFKIKISIS